MGVKVSGNSEIESAIRADQLDQGDVAKVVTVDHHLNAYAGAVNCFLLRGSKFDVEGAMVFMPNNSIKIIATDQLHHYRVVRMPKGFVLSIEVQ